MGHIEGPGLPKPSFPTRKSDRRVLRGYCGAQQFVDQAHLSLERPKAQSEESCGPSSTTQSTKQFLGSSRGQFSPRQIHNPTRIKGQNWNRDELVRKSRISWGSYPYYPSR